MSDTYGVTINGEEYEVDAGSPEEAQRKVANLYGQPVPFKEGFRPPVQHTPRELAEGALEGAPMAGGMAGAALGAAPGAALGAAGGEAVRQLGRRAMGAPAATGLVTDLTGMDPDSPKAAAANIALEGLLGGAGEKMAQAARWAKSTLSNWATKSRVSLLGPSSAIDQAQARELAERLATEGIAPAGSSRARQVANAQARLSEASSARKAVEQSHAEDSLNASRVLDEVLAQEPKRLPGGEIPQVGRPERRAHRLVAEDVLASLSGGGETPLPVAQGEKRRWDALLQSFYERGALTPAIGQKYTKGAADAWRGAIADAFPDLGTANLRESELIDILRLLQTQQTAEFVGKRSIAGPAAAAGGAGAAGRWSIPAAVASKGLLSGPRFTSMSAAGKDLAARLLMDPAKAQMYVRLGSLATFDPDAIRRRREAEKLLAQGEGVTQP